MIAPIYKCGLQCSMIAPIFTDLDHIIKAMDAQNGRSRTIQSSQAKIWDIIYGFSDSLILRCAVELGLADIIHKAGQPITLSELASQLPFDTVNKDHLYRIMRYLVHMKLFTKQARITDNEVLYGLAPAGTYLVSGWDQCMSAAILTVTDKDMVAPWHHLTAALSASSPTAFETALGKDIWSYMAGNPDMNKLFNEGMANDSRLLTSALIEECGDMFRGASSIVDVGGGTGTALRAIAAAFPDVNCTVFDLPHVIADSPEYPEVTRMSGDMFKSIPTADIVLMKCILHDWEDEDCVKILKNCKESVAEGGKVIIVDMVLDPKSRHPLTHMRMCMDLDMMLNTGGKERTEEEWKNLIKSAGYSDYNIKHISAAQSVIQAFPH